MLIVLTILLGVSALGMWLRLRLLKKEVAQITDTIHRIHGEKSNEKITVSFRDQNITELAGAVNGLYDDIHRERASHSHAMVEMRESLANISHDLRTPLTSVIGYVKLLQKGDNTPEQQQHYLSVISGKSYFLNELINNLFMLTRLESGAYQFTLEQLNIVEQLSEELAGFYHVFTEGGGQPAIQLPEQPVWVIGDKTAYSRVFHNLMQNMVKHGKENICIQAKEEGDTVILRFSNGVQGLTQQDVKQIFQRFFTADRMRSGENTGLGLSIVREFIEQMGGTITAELKDDRLTFVISLKKI